MFSLRLLLMNTITIKKCPLCTGTRLEHALTCVDSFSSGETFRLCRCRDCGFLFTQGFPSGSEMERYYDAPGYISHSDTHRGLVNTVYHYARAYMLRRKGRFVERESHRNGGRLLDVGAGTGYFANAMKRRGWQVDAVEKNAGARTFAMKRFALEMQPEEALPGMEEGSYDVITLWHVMEHIEKLNETWAQLNRLLTAKGVLIVAVPNHSSYDARRYGACWAAYDVPRHLWHFVPSTMQRFGAKHGFILAGRYPMPLDAFYVSMLTEKYMHRVFPFLRGLWTGTLAWFASMIRMERSSSMIYIFRKR